MVSTKTVVGLFQSNFHKEFIFKKKAWSFVWKISQKVLQDVKLSF